MDLYWLPVIAWTIASGGIEADSISPPPGGRRAFDSRRSWLLGEIAAPARVAAAAAVVSLLLVALTFNPWFLIATAINLAIIAIAL